MKKIRPFVLGLLIGAILMLSVGVFATEFFQFIKSENTLYVEGQKIEVPMYNYEYTNYAPLRAVAETLGLDVSVTGTRIDMTIVQGVNDKMADNSNNDTDVINYATTKEIASFLVKSFNFKDNGTRYDIKGIDKSDQYYVDLCIALSYEIFGSPESFRGLHSYVTRYQLAWLICNNILDLGLSEDLTEPQFKPNAFIPIDIGNLPAWSRQCVTASVYYDFLDLYPDGTFRGDELLTTPLEPCTDYLDIMEQHNLKFKSE